MITFFRLIVAGLMGYLFSYMGYGVNNPEFWIGLTLLIAYGEARYFEE